MARTRSAEARQKALTAAQDVLGDLSVEGFTVEEVAKRSGVAKTTIYRHWQSGNTLMLDALDCMVHTFPVPDTGSLAGDLEVFMGDVLPVVSDPKLMKTMLGVLAAAVSDPEIAEIHQSMMAERMDPLRTMVEAAKERGELPAALDTDLVIDVIEGPFFMRKMIRRQPIDEATMRQMVDVIVSGLTSRR